MPDKVIIPGKVERLSKRKFKVRKDKDFEIDAEIDIADDGDYQVEKLDVTKLPPEIDGTLIRWFTNFAIKKNGKYISQRYSVTIPGLSSCKKVVVFDGKGNLYYYDGKVKNDTLELTDGDPGLGGAP
jgi:hypothetical protein